MAFVPSRLRGVVMRSVIDGLRERGLDYIVKTSGEGLLVRRCRVLLLVGGCLL